MECKERSLSLVRVASSFSPRAARVHGDLSALSIIQLEHLALVHEDREKRLRTVIYELSDIPYFMVNTDAASTFHLLTKIYRNHLEEKIYKSVRKMMR